MGKRFSFIYSVTCFLTGSMESSDASSSESSVSIRTASHGSTVSVAVAGACSSILSGPWGSVYCGLCIVLLLYRLF